MRGYVLLTSVALGLAGATSTAVGPNCNTIQYRGTGYLGVINGQVRVISPRLADYDWDFTVREGKRPIRVLAPQRWRGWYLTYDPEGKDKTVFLTKTPGVGTEWELTSLRDPAVGVDVYTIRAAEGKLKGWYLDIDPKGEQLKDAKAKSFTAYRVLLSDTPKHLPKGAAVSEIAP